MKFDIPVTCEFCTNDLEYLDLKDHLEEYHKYKYGVDAFWKRVSEEMEKCEYCDNQMPRFAIADHERTKHKECPCPHCNNLMPETSLEKHKEEKHALCDHCKIRMNKSQLEQHIDQLHALCKYCNNRMQKSQLKQHIMEKHQTQSQIGTLFRNNHTDEEINRHIKNNKVYVQNGFFYLRN